MLSDISDTQAAPSDDRLLTESEALEYTRRWKEVKPERQPAVRSMLQRYAESRTGLPMFPAYEERKQNFARATEALWLDGDDRWKTITGREAYWGGDPQQRADFARMSFMRMMGGDIDRMQQGGLGPMRMRLADHWKNPAVATDDAALDNEIKTRLQAERDKRFLVQGYAGDNFAAPALKGKSVTEIAGELRKANGDSMLGYITRGADAGEPFEQVLSEFQESVQGKPGAQHIRDADVEQQARAWYGARRAMAEKAKTAADAVFPELVKEFKGGGGNLETATAALLPLSRDEREIAFQYLHDAAAGQAGGMGAWEAVRTTFGRAVTSIFGGAKNDRVRKELVKHYEAGSLVYASSKKAEDEAYQNIWARVRNSGEYASDNLELRELTAAEAAQWNKDNARLLDQLDLADQVEKFGQQAVDPVQGNWWVQKKLVNPLVESVPTMLLAANPTALLLTFPALAGGYANDEYARLRETGMAPRDAHNAAEITGLLQAGVDAMQVAKLAGKLPIVDRLFRKATLPGSVAKRAVVNFTGTLTFETGSELFQDHIIPALVQDATNSNPAFDPVWGEVWKEIGRQAGDTALGMVLLSGAGAAYQTKADTALIRDLTASRASMRAMGYSMANIEEIQAAPMEQRGALLVKFEPKKAPEGPERATLVKEAVALLAEERAKAQTGDAQLSAEMRANGITVDRAKIDGQDRFRVTGPGGVVTEHATAEDARRAVEGHLDAEYVKVNKPALDMLAALEARPESPTTESRTQITGQQDSAADALLAAEKAGNTGLADSMRQRMAVEQAKTPDAPIDWRKMSFAGQSVLEVQDSVLTAVTRIEAGASALTPLEERAETDAAAWVKSGETTWTDLAGIIREVESATGDTYLHGHTGGKDAAQDETATREAYSALTRIYATARGRDGTIGAVARGERAGAQERLRQAERSGVAGPIMARLRAAWEWFKETMRQSARLNKARREGKLGEVETFLRRSVGIDSDAEVEVHVLEDGEVTTEKQTLSRTDAAETRASLTGMLPFYEKARAGLTAAPGAKLSEVLKSAAKDGTVSPEVISHIRDAARQAVADGGAPDENTGALGILDQLRAAVEQDVAGIDSALANWEAGDQGAHARGVAKEAAAIFGENSTAGPQGELFPENTGDSVVRSERTTEQETNPPGGSAEVVTPPSTAPAVQDGGGAAPGTSQGFNLSPTATLDAISEALGTRMARDPEARRQMVDKAQAALAEVRESERERAERRAAVTGERDQRAADADQKEADDLQAAQATETAEMQSRHQQEITEANEAAAAEMEELRIRQGIEVGGAKDENRPAAWLDAQSVRHGRERDRAAAAARKALATLKARQRREAKDMKVRHTNDADDMRVKHERAAVRRETGAQRAEEKATMMRNLRILDAVLASFPPDVRAKVGGWTQIARLTTDDAMSKELHRRLDMLDKELEASLQKSLTDEIFTLLDKASPKRKGGEKPKGHLGAETHRFFDEVADVVNLPADEIEARRTKINEALAKLTNAGELTPEKAAAAWEAEQILDQYGNLADKSAAHLARSLDMLTDVYETGRNKWRTSEEARLEEVRGLVQDTVRALGGVSKAAIQEQKDKADKAFSILKSGKWSIKSFTEVMEALFGRNHVLAIRWSQAVRKGFAQRTNEVVGLVHRWRAAMHKATGLKGRKARHVVWEMSHKQTLEIHTSPFKARDEQIPMEKFAQVLAGEAEASALGLSAADVETLTQQFEALPPESRKGNLTLRRVTPGKGEAVKYTEAEGIFLSMLYAQEGYQEAMERDGLGPDAMQEIEEQLSPAAKELRGFLRKEYDAGYMPLARVFERMFGVSLPSIPNYAPGAFYHSGASEANVDPFGPIVPEGGFRASFLRDRKQHTAAPKPESAFSTFFGHFSQSAHWRNLAEVTRELRGVFGNPEVKQALRGAHGAEAEAKVSEWLKAIEGNGINVGSSKLARAIFTMQAHVALAWKLGTLMKQSTALLGAWYRMPTGAYLRGLGRLFTGRLNALDMWKSDTMQRRIVAGFTPEVRAVMANAWNTEPTWRNAFLERGLEVIGLTDAFFTTGSAAISWDYHYRQAIKNGLSPEAARAVAEQEAADMVARTAQPVEVADRSLMELNLGGLGRAVFVFASESRQKSSLWLTAMARTLTGKGTRDDARVLFISHMILGSMIQAITSLWRDMRDDDDGDDDIQHWSPGDFLISAALSPLAGIPLAREVVDAFHGESGPLARYYYAFVAGKQLLLDGPEATDPEKIEWYAKRAFALLQAGGSFTAVSANIGDQAFRIGDNLFDDELERGKKQLRKEAAARDALREGALTEEQKEAREAAKSAETEAKLRDAAKRAK